MQQSQTLHNSWYERLHDGMCSENDPCTLFSPTWLRHACRIYLCVGGDPWKGHSISYRSSACLENCQRALDSPSPSHSIDRGTPVILFTSPYYFGVRTKTLLQLCYSSPRHKREQKKSSPRDPREKWLTDLTSVLHLSRHSPTTALKRWFNQGIAPTPAEK